MSSVILAQFACFAAAAATIKPGTAGRGRVFVTFFDNCFDTSFLGQEGSEWVDDTETDLPVGATWTLFIPTLFRFYFKV